MVQGNQYRHQPPQNAPRPPRLAHSSLLCPPLPSQRRMPRAFKGRCAGQAWAPRTCVGRRPGGTVAGCREWGALAWGAVSVEGTVPGPPGGAAWGLALVQTCEWSAGPGPWVKGDDGATKESRRPGPGHGAWAVEGEMRTEWPREVAAPGRGSRGQSPAPRQGLQQLPRGSLLAPAHNLKPGPLVRLISYLGLCSPAERLTLTLHLQEGSHGHTCSRENIKKS